MHGHSRKENKQNLSCPFTICFNIYNIYYLYSSDHYYVYALKNNGTFVYQYMQEYYCEPSYGRRGRLELYHPVYTVNLSNPIFFLITKYLYQACEQNN